MGKAASRKKQDWVDLVFTSHDGLRLRGRQYPAAPSPAAKKSRSRTKASNKRSRPLLCLSSLTGNAAEFHPLAAYLSRNTDHPRDVYCPDYRGRGRSEADYSSRNYTPYVELRDILDFLVFCDLPHVDVLGSSRGAINAMLFASVRPSAIGSIILNDLGPVLEPDGVARLLGYLTDMPRPANWNEAAQVMRSMYEKRFPALGREDWQALAKCRFTEKNGRIVPSYDERLALTGRSLNLQKTMPDMWAQYLGLSKYPLLIIRGENSDMLSHETVEQMTTLHWGSKAVTVPGQGHSPLLRDRASHVTINTFLTEND